MAEFVRCGLAVPPAPREFIADQMPGAAKLHKPNIVTLYNVERYHFTMIGPV